MRNTMRGLISWYLLTFGVVWTALNPAYDSLSNLSVSGVF